MCKEIISVKEIGIDRVGDQLCMFGEVEVEYETNEACMRVIFDSLPCNNMANILNMITANDKNINQCGKVILPGLKIYSIKMNINCFNKTVRKIFGLALGTIPSEFMEMNLKFKEEWE